MFPLQNPDYMKDGFFIKIESLHLPDKGTTENVSISCKFISSSNLKFLSRP